MDWLKLHYIATGLLLVDRMEEERERDLKERDALAERIKKKDKEHTRKIVEKSDKKVCGKEFMKFYIPLSLQYFHRDMKKL